MRVCPNCNFLNNDTYDICVNCERSLPLTALIPELEPTPARAARPAASTPAPARQGQQKRYVLGLLLGLIPLVIIMIIYVVDSSLSVQGGCFTAQCAPAVELDLLDVFLALAFLLLLVLGAAIACLLIARARFVGYGLLTALIISLLISYVVLANSNLPIL
jgi:hypothetical protein